VVLGEPPHILAWLLGFSSVGSSFGPCFICPGLAYIDHQTIIYVFLYFCILSFLLLLSVYFV
jgi:hypothetical protein